nr:hypothetical protein [Janthinobacterium sp. AD80]
MIAHQHISMQMAWRKHQTTAQIIKIALLVLPIRKACLAIHSTLHHMQRNAGQDEAKAAGYGNS